MLIIAATPIGNLQDASERLKSAMQNADLVACEDTRVAGKLYQALGMNKHPEFIALHDHNEKERAAFIVERAGQETVLLLSDAGMPTVSDPGFAVVAEAIRSEVELTVIPGPSAPITALALSGLPTDRFTFEGFLPRKAGAARQRLAEIENLPHTLIFFESAQRLPATVKLLAEVLGPERKIAIARELTKKFEEVIRGTIEELAGKVSGLRGEICVVVEGKTGRITITIAEATTLVLEHIAEGKSVSASVKIVAAETGVSKNELYNAALAAKQS